MLYELADKIGWNFQNLPPHGKIMVTFLVVGGATIVGWLVGSGQIQEWCDYIRSDLVADIRLIFNCKKYKDLYGIPVGPYKVRIKRKMWVNVRSGPGTEYTVGTRVGEGIWTIEEDYVDRVGRVWGKLNNNRGEILGWICLNPKYTSTIRRKVNE